MPSIKAPSCKVTLPEDSCSFRVLTGMFELIHAGAMTGLNPSSSALYPFKTAANPSLAMPVAEAAPDGAPPMAGACPNGCGGGWAGAGAAAAGAKAGGCAAACAGALAAGANSEAKGDAGVEGGVMTGVEAIS